MVFLFVWFLAMGCSDQLPGTAAPNPSITTGGEKVHYSKKTWCWNSPCPGTITFLKPTDQYAIKVKPDQKIEVRFTDPEPSTINLHVNHLEKNEKLEVSDTITAPRQPGIYDYNIIPYWNRNKGQTWGMANYSFRLVVE